jgi:hypothetical protein
MDDAQLNRTSARESPCKASWTPRIILWTLACCVGLWLGAGTRTSAAGGQTNRPSAAAQAALADIFRFDILLAGKEPIARAVQSKAAPEKQYHLPAAVLVATLQRPEPVSSVMPRTLACTRPRFMIAPPARPAGAWSMNLEANMARLEPTQRGLRALLATVQGLTFTDRKSIQIEVDKACAQIGVFRSEPMLQAPEPPEPAASFPPADLPDAWPERGTQLMPY